MPRIAATWAAAVGAVVAAVLAFAGPALAHVTVNPKEATQGGFTKVTFRVPNEKNNASTTKVEVNLPAGTPIPSVSLKPLAGWAAQTEKSKLAKPIKTDDGELTEAITKITWTADPNSAIKPGQFQEFDVSLGPLPETDQIVFKALQTYSDGDVVRWIEEPSANGTEPDHPAPALKLVKQPTGTPTATAVTAVAADNAAVKAHGHSDGGPALGLGIAGLVLGLAGLIAGLLAYRRAGRAS